MATFVPSRYLPVSKTKMQYNFSIFPEMILWISKFAPHITHTFANLVIFKILNPDSYENVIKTLKMHNQLHQQLKVKLK